MLPILGDLTFWTVVSIAVVILMAIIGPRFGKRGKIGIRAHKITQIKNVRDLRHSPITYLVDGEEISGNIFAVEVEISNRGLIDITTDAFRDPVQLTVARPMKIVSVAASDDNQPSLRLTQTREDFPVVECSWDLLKRSEKVRLAVLCTGPAVEFPKESDFRFSCRLVNVDVRNANRNRVRIFGVAFLIGFLLMMLPGVGLGTLDSDSRFIAEDHLLADAHPHQRYIDFRRSSISEFRLCEQRDLSRWEIFAKCGDWTEDELAITQIKEVAEDGAFIGLPFFGVLLILGNAVLYGLFVGVTAALGPDADRLAEKYLRRRNG